MHKSTGSFTVKCSPHSGDRRHLCLTLRVSQAIIVAPGTTTSSQAYCPVDPFTRFPAISPVPSHAWWTAGRRTASTNWCRGFGYRPHNHPDFTKRRSVAEHRLPARW